MIEIKCVLATWWETSIAFSMNIMLWSKAFMPVFSSHHYSVKHVVEFVAENIRIVLPHFVHHNHVFCENYKLVEILLGDSFISFFIRESHGGAQR